MMVSLSSIICLSFWAAILMRSSTGSNTYASDPLMALMRDSLVNDEAPPSASSSFADALPSGALDKASASIIPFPGTQRALN